MLLEAWNCSVSASHHPRPKIGTRACHVVGTLYDFRETAGHAIVTLFEKDSIRHKLLFQWRQPFHHSHILKRRYTPSSACLYQQFHIWEDRQEPDVFEDEKIIRKGGIYRSLNLFSCFWKGKEVIKFHDEVPIIELENIIRRCSSSSERKEARSRLSLQPLGRVESLCGCRIEQASDSTGCWWRPTESMFLRREFRS